MQTENILGAWTRCVHLKVSQSLFHDVEQIFVLNKLKRTLVYAQKLVSDSPLKGTKIVRLMTVWIQTKNKVQDSIQTTFRGTGSRPVIHP